MENPYSAPETDSAISTKIDRELPASPIPLDPMWCLRKAWHITTQNFTNAFVLIVLPFIISSMVNALCSPIAMLIDGSETKYINMFGTVVKWQAQNYGLASFASTTINLVVGTLISMGTLHVCLMMIDKRSPHFGDVFSQSKKLLKMLAASLLFGIVIWIGLLLLIFPGIYLLCRYGFFYIAIVDKNLGIIESFKYSSELSKNNRTNIFMLGCLVFGIYIVGFLTCCIGLLWAIPIAMLTISIAYCYLHHGEDCIKLEIEG